MAPETKGAPLAVLALAAGVLLPVAALIGVVVLLITVIAPPASSAACSSSPAAGGAGSGGEWVATAYGPPWEGIQGSGVTATGIDLRPAKHAYIVAVDPSVIPLGSSVHVSPNPFGDDSITFLAADTGADILGQHIDIYDWEGRGAQDAWGSRKVTVTLAAPAAGAGNVLEATPAATLTPGQTPSQASAQCQTPGVEGPLPLTAGQSARVLPDGLAAAPKEAPDAVKAMIAAGNRLDHASYLYGGAHGTSLNTLQPAYDCSSSVSYLLHAAGLLSEFAEDSTELESFGEPGPGRWVTLYANSEHVFAFVAGVRFDTVYTPAFDEGPNAGVAGPRWRVYPGVPEGSWVVRHPPGL